jgi:AcrR family transcriptional regulator
MPKVTDKYMMDKRKIILDGVGEVYKEKQLFQIVMRDIIKKVGCSQGAIYRYYSNLDEIYLDFINSNTTQYPLEQTIDEILSSDRSRATIISEGMAALGSYLDETLKSPAGKMYFELLPLCAHDSQRTENILSRVKYRQCLGSAQQKMVEYLISNIQQGLFRPSVDIEALLMFICVSIDGIAIDAAQSMTRDDKTKTDFKVDVPEMFAVLAKAMINLLGADN